jgi:hypothetical protein
MTTIRSEVFYRVVIRPTDRVRLWTKSHGVRCDQRKLAAEHSTGSTKGRPSIVGLLHRRPAFTNLNVLCNI